MNEMMYRAKPSRPSLRMGHPLARDMVGFYTPVGVGVEARDLGSAQLPGQVGTGVSYARGSYGGVYRLDGTSTSVIDIPVVSEEAYQSNLWSMTCRFRSTRLTGVRRLISTQNNGGVLWFLRTNGTKPECGFADSNGSLKTFAVPSVSLTEGRWYTMTTMIDASRAFRLYLDGQLIGSSTLPGTGHLKPEEPLLIGQYQSNLERFEGDIDYVAIHRRALSGTEVGSLHTAPFAMMRGVFSLWLGLADASGCVPGGPGGVSLSQAAEASFPDRGSVGLKVTLEASGDGRYLERDLGVSHSLVHARVMFNPATVSGGWVTLMRGEDAGSGDAFELTYNSGTRGVTLTLGTGATLTGVLPSGLDWNCLELKLDADGGAAALWLNGVEVDTYTGTLSSLSVRRVWLGAPFKQSGAVGDLYLDEWKLGDDYLGPVVVEATSASGDDPARWLVIYNTSNADSVAWAEWYRAARGVPYANLLGLNLSSDEEISEAAFTSMRQSVADYLALNGLDDQVLGILCGHGVPGTYVDGLGDSESIAGQLHRMDGGSGAVLNGLSRSVDDATMARPSAVNLSGHRMTARIDGVDLAGSRLPTERAMTFEAAGFDGSDALEGADAQIWLDPYGPAGSVYDAHRDLMLGWSSSAAGGLTRLDRVAPSAPVGSEDTSHGLIERDGFYWGWGSASPGAGLFGAAAGRRLFCGVLWYEDATSGSLRSGSTGWAQAALGAGYAAVGVSTRARTATAIPQAGGFFGALRRGWTLGEAWFVANPVLRAGLTLVGDPLARMTLPRRGWNVYGPFESWADVDLSGAPRVALGADAQTFTLDVNVWPDDGAVGLYVVRGVDGLGREETGTRHVRFERSGTAALGLAWAPAWPGAPGWSAVREGDGWRLSAAWADRFGAMSVSRVDLIEEIQGGGEQVVATETVDGRQSRVSWLHEPGGTVARYCFAAVHESGAVVRSPWSTWMTRVTVSSIDLEKV